jgi:leucyl aminopeptidase (aminopeptidase T)
MRRMDPDRGRATSARRCARRRRTRAPRRWDARANHGEDRSAAVAAAGEARFTCPKRSDMRLDLADRRGIPEDGHLTAGGPMRAMLEAA